MNTDFGLIANIIGIVFNFIPVIILFIAVWKDGSITHKIILGFLILLFFQNIYLSSFSYENNPAIPIFLILAPIFFCVSIFIIFKLGYRPLFFYKIENNDELVNIFIKNVQGNGVKSIAALEIMAKAFSNGNGHITIESNEATEILIRYAKKWSTDYYSTKNSESGYLASAAFLSIANIAVANKIENGIRFVEKEIEDLTKNNSPEENDILKLMIPIAQRIIIKKEPDFENYP